MTNLSQTSTQTKLMIDDLKAVCTNYGLGNASSEYKIITEIFLYKFINDKFLFEAREVNPDYKDLSFPELEAKLIEMSEDDYDLFLLGFRADTAKLKQEQFISHLFNKQNEEDFHRLFDKTLLDISNINMAVFSVQAGGKAKIRLFDPISPHIIESENKDNFCRALINKIARCSFANVFEQKYDFFATIFEYLIKDYNKDFGKYAEYYTPHAIAHIMAKIMVPEGAENVTVYDPAAGTGTLVLALAHEIGENRCAIYAQDISQKSNEFLRLNLILNNLVHSLPNVIKDNTLTNPRHLSKTKDKLMSFDYIVSNPPFKADFSESREILAGEKHQKRFFAGVPKVPPKKKDNMEIYLMFLQHIIYTLNENGKAAVVVPTGFLTAGSGIPKKIREYLVEENMLRGVVSMPSNIFATTGTNVSILFIDKSNKDGDIVLMDASNLGKKIKEDGKNQKTVLSSDEIDGIISTFNSMRNKDDFCVVVNYNDIKNRKYSFSAGQYFEIKIKYVEMTSEDFSNKMTEARLKLNDLFTEGQQIEEEITKQLRKIKYE